MIWQIGFFVGAVLVISVCAVIYVKKNGYADKKKQYDERQNEIRGKSYKYAVWTMAICAGVYFCITALSGKSFAEDGVSALVIAFLGGAVFTVYSIFNDSFFGLTERTGSVSRRSFLITLAIVAAGSCYNSVRVVADHELVRNGLLTVKCVNLVFAVYFLIILLSLGIKKYIEMKAERGEE